MREERFLNSQRKIHMDIQKFIHKPNYKPGRLLILSCIFKNIEVFLCISQETAWEKFWIDFCMRKILIIPQERLFLATANGSCFKYWVILFSLGLSVFFVGGMTLIVCHLTHSIKLISLSLHFFLFFFPVFVVIIWHAMQWVLCYLTL